MRKVYWYITAYLRKHGLKVLLVVALGVGFFSLLLPFIQRSFAHRRTHYIGIIGEYDLHNLPAVIENQLSRGLVEMNPDGSFAPLLADELTIDPEGLRYTFAFTTAHQWQDGQVFVPTDVNYHLQDAQVTYDTNQIVYELPEVFASFPQLLTQPLLRYSMVKKWGFWQQEQVYGLGSASMIDYSFADSSNRTLAQVVLFDRTTRERWVYRFYYTQDQAITAYKLGEVDVLFEMTNLGDIKDWPTTKVQERLLADQYLAVFFNCTDPMLTRSVRQALSYAVEKERAGYVRAPGPIAETSWAFFKGLQHYDKNTQMAVERLLDELPAAALEIKLTTTTAYFDIANDIKNDWEEVGRLAAEACRKDEEVEDKTPCEYLQMRVSVQTVTFPDTNNYQTLLIGHQVATDPDQYGLWHSDLATNFTHYKNTRVDSVLEKGRQVVSPKERLALYQQFQQDLMEDPPAIFLWNLKSYD